jgi:hypothetical protein
VQTLRIFAVVQTRRLPLVQFRWGLKPVLGSFEAAQGGCKPVLESFEVAQGGCEPVLESFEAAQGGCEPVLKSFEVAQGGCEPVLESFEVAQRSCEPVRACPGWDRGRPCSRPWPFPSKSLARRLIHRILTDAKAQIWALPLATLLQ